MKRVWCLYRVSTKKQVNTDDDIPMQRNACHTFVSNKPDWKITNELSEKGISGWAKKADERDALNTIKQGAINRDFDILLVFMFDRLGRREDETPLVVSFLNENKVEVWSVEEGKRSTETHTDKLLNYISFWQSDGESQKTSARVRESKKQLSEQGFFQGGPAPIGYKIIETDQVHWKNKDRHIKELVPDEKESELVKLVFNLYIDRHMGYRKIVDYLNTNGHRTRDGKIIGISTIQRMLENPIYIGRKRYNCFDGQMKEQPYNPKLQIVLDDIFNQAQEIKNKRREKLNDQDKTGIPLTGKLMFSGLAYCKYCGSKLSGNYLYRKQQYKNKDGYYTNTVYRYRCPLNKGKFNCNHEKNIWGAKKYDKLIIQQIKDILKQFDIKSYIDHSVVKKKTKIKQKEQNLKTLEKEYLKLVRELEKLNSEIAKSLLGESVFTPQQLSSAIENLNKKIEENQTNTNDLRNEIDNENGNYSDVNFLANELDNWEEKFDSADDDLKKAMLSRIIDKVYFSKDEIDIELNLMLDETLIKQNS